MMASIAILQGNRPRAFLRPAQNRDHGRLGQPGAIRSRNSSLGSGDEVALIGSNDALRQTDGRLRYVDFDYFGWDDPAKLTADFLLHPAMQLSADDRSGFVRRMMAALPGSIIVAAALPVAMNGGPIVMAAIGAAIIVAALTRNDFLAVMTGMGIAALARAAGLG